MKEIKNVALLKPVLVYSVADALHYVSKKGVIIVEYTDNTKSELELENMVDLTKNIDWEIKAYKKTKMKFLFKNSEV